MMDTLEKLLLANNRITVLENRVERLRTALQEARKLIISGVLERGMLENIDAALATPEQPSATDYARADKILDLLAERDALAQENQRLLSIAEAAEEMAKAIAQDFNPWEGERKALANYRTKVKQK